MECADNDDRHKIQIYREMTIITNHNFMKIKNFLAMTAAAALAMASCGNLDDEMNGNGGSEPVTDTFPDEEAISGDVSGIWEANSTVYVNGHLIIPEGSSLVIEEGVKVIFDRAGVGANHAAIEVSVDGNLYCCGVEGNPVTFTVFGAENIEEKDKMDGFWGGIVAGSTCGEMLIDHTVIEYTGGQVVEGSPASVNGYYTAGDDAYPQITTNNVNGKYVITNSIIRNGWSDGIYMMGGNAIISGNIFSCTGYDGAEAVNVKSGCKVDVAGNIMFSPNTNGLKLSSSNQSEVRQQALINAYNNTIINSGWRRDGEKGGSIYVEENARVNVFNNLMVNCKFRAMTPSLDNLANVDGGYDAANSMIDYNFYASGNVPSTIIWEGTYEDDGETLTYSGVRLAYEGYDFNHEDYYVGVVDENSIIADSESKASELNPDFVNYDINSDPSLTVYDDSWDFHVNAGSPVLSGAYTAQDKAPYFASAGLSVNGTEYRSPAVQGWFGAFGTR